MASRVVVPQQARGVTVHGGGENNNNNNNKVHKKNAGLGDGRNRRALGDIGNLVTDRPITRSFRAQLIANAEAAKVADNKKHVNVNVNVKGVIPNHEAPKANQKKPNNEKHRHQKKPIAEEPEVIEISPDSEKVVEKESQEKQTSEAKSKDIGSSSSSSRKKGPTLTSVLTARSKLACGISNKPKEMIMDIDSEDVNNELAVVEYIEDMYKFYKLVEHENRPHDYIESQPEINEQMRAILVDWLVEVHRKFELSPETFYLTINIIDRFLSVKTVTRRELQLVGISAMLTASKYEEIWAPEVNDFVALTAGAYSQGQVLRMEKVILGKLEWTLTVPTPYVFLVRFIKASLPNDKKVESMVYFLAELGMMHYETISYGPSMVAASAVYAARAALSKVPVWDGTLKLHTGFSEDQVTDCAKLLASLHLRASKDKLRSVFSKYASSSRGSVAHILPAISLLPAPAADSKSA